MKALNKYIIAILPGLFSLHAKTQNLVPNPSFESLPNGCPTGFYQIYKAVPWFSPDCYTLRPDTRDYAVLFNACNTDIASVPTNALCTQLARTGVGYAGIEVLSAYDLVYRQYLETKLTKTLVSGKKYYFSMYFNLCNQFVPALTDLVCFRPDSTGVVFSSAANDNNPNCLNLPLKPDIHANSTPVRPGDSWHLIEGCYVAKGNEEYIIIGNFAREAASSCSVSNEIAYLIFIDDVSLISEINKTIDTTICSDEIWELNSRGFREEYLTMEGWNYVWEDGDTSANRSFAEAGVHTLTVSKNGCFNDVYRINVNYNKECDCTLFVPGAFTPNNDGLNDKFIPHISCSNLPVSNYKLAIYDRWGRIVFSSTDPLASWDGSYNGKKLSNQVYVWQVTYNIGNAGKVFRKQKSGTVASIR